MLARWVSRSWVWRMSVMSEPTPRKPSKRPAVSMIGSPAIEIQRGPRAVFNSISSELNGLLLEQHAAQLGVAAEQRGQRIADDLVRRAAEQGAHPRADVGDAILAIDLPQPADAALLIFLQQQAELSLCEPTSALVFSWWNAQRVTVSTPNTETPKREQDRQHVLEGHAAALEDQDDAQRRR